MLALLPGCETTGNGNQATVKPAPKSAMIVFLRDISVTPGIDDITGGRLLIEHARKLKGPLELDVNEQNPEARKFYEAMGFEVHRHSETDSDGRPFPLLHLRDRRANSAEES